MLRRCLPGLICGVAQPSRAAQRAAGRELTRGGRRGGCFESLPRSGREALGLPSRAASRQPGSHTLVEDEPSLLACPPPEPGCPRPPLTSVPKHQRGCRCSANQPPRGHPGAPQPLFWHPGSRSGGDDDGCVGATRRQPRSWGRAPGAWPGGTRGQAALHHGRPPLGPGAQQAAEAEGAWGARGSWRWWGASSWLPRTRWLWSGGEARVWVRLGTPLLWGGGWGALLGCLGSFLAT